MEGRAGGRRRVHVLVQAALFVASAYLSWHAWAGAAATRQVSYPEFIENIRPGRAEAVEISSTELVGRLRDEAGADATPGAAAAQPQAISAVRPPEVSDPELLPLLREKGVRVVGAGRAGRPASALFLSAFPSCS